MNSPLDISVAEQGLKDATAVCIGDDDSAKQLRKAFNEMVINNNKWWTPWYTCQDALDDLIKQMQELSEKDNKEKDNKKE